MKIPRINLLSIAIQCFTVAVVLLVVLLSGCESGYVTSGAHHSTHSAKTQQAISNIGGLDSPWLRGVDDIIQTDMAPDNEAKFAYTKCPGDVLFLTSVPDMSVAFHERLLIHEAWEIQHGCDDYDVAANAFARCYAEGGTYDGCKAKIYREYY